MGLTIKEFSKITGIVCSTLREQLNKIGISVSDEDLMTKDMKQSLLESLRRKHGDTEDYSNEENERKYLRYNYSFKKAVIENNLIAIKVKLSNLEHNHLQDIVNNFIFPTYDTHVDEWSNGATRSIKYESEPALINFAIEQKNEDMAIYLLDVFFLQFGHVNSRKLIIRYLSLAIELNASHELLAKLIQISPEFSHNDIDDLLLSNNMLSKEQY